MLVIDVETTGVDPQKNAIVSIGAVDFLNPARHFYMECRIFDGAEIDERALEINGFTHEQIKDPNKPPLRELMKHFLIWAEQSENKTIAGHNPHFDMGFLKASAERTGFFWTFPYRTVDLHTVCYSHYMQRGVQPPQRKGRTDIDVDTVHTYVGLPEEPKPHHGLRGAKMEAESFSRLLNGRNLLSEFAHYSLPDYLR